MAFVHHLTGRDPTWRRWRALPVAFSVDTRKMADRQTQRREGAAVPNDHSVLVWVLDQTLGLLKRSARTAEQEEAVKELRMQALLPKPDKAKIESLVHRLETMVSITPEFMRTRLPLKRAGVIEAHPVRITLDRELNRLIESIGKKTGANRTPGKKIAPKKPTGKIAPKKPAGTIAPKKPARKVSPKKPAVTVGGKKTAATVAGRKPARKVAPKKPARKVAAKKTVVKVGGKKTAAKAGAKKTTAVKNVPTKKTRKKVVRHRSP